MTKQILHRLICPDCERPFIMALDKGDIEEIIVHLTSDGIAWSAYLCRQCGKGVNERVK